MHTRISITGDRPEGRWADNMGNGLATGEKQRRARNNDGLATREKRRLYFIFTLFSGLSFTARVLLSTLINQKPN